MLEFLQSNLALVGGAFFVIVLLGVRASSADRSLRDDLRGAISLLIGFILLRLTSLALVGHIPRTAERGLAVLWMLTFAFGITRGCVAVGLYALRLRKGRPTPKILRDVLDFTLYGLTAVPILKSELNIDLTGLVATSAILSIVLGLALQDTLGNLFAGLAIQLERPFEVGDIVKIGQYTGQVLQIGFRAIRVETFRQELITLPNNTLSKEAVHNFSRGHYATGVGVDTHITLSNDAPPNVVKAVIYEVLHQIPLVLSKPKPVVRPMSFEENGVKYQIRYFVADWQTSYDVLDEFNTLLWYRLKREGLEVPYPQRVVRQRDEVAPQTLSHPFLTDLLRTVDLFKSLSAEDYDGLARELPVKRFGRGEHVIRAGDLGNSFYIVASGEVSVRAGRNEAEVTRLRRGEYFGEMSLLTGEPRAATVVTTEDSVMLQVERSTFSRLFEAYPGLAKQLSALLAQRRTQLREAAAKPDPHEAARVGSDILGRLRNIFGLRGE